MLVAGLTGGMACGKTFVAGALHDLGCHIIEADELGREVMAPGGGAFHNILQIFGRDILAADGSIDRQKLAARVFTHPPSIAKLNAIVHPAVRARARQEFEAIGQADPRAIVIYIAAILIESGAYREAAKIIVVTCRREQQIERAMQRPGAVQADVLARLATQMPLEEKLKFADYVIDTSGTKEDTLRQTREVYEELRRLSG